MEKETPEKSIEFFHQPKVLLIALPFDESHTSIELFELRFLLSNFNTTFRQKN